MPASTTQFPINNPRVDGPGTPRVNYIELGNTPTPPCAGCVCFRQSYGGHSERETPGPIPNPEVKPFSADGTATERLWESRTPPDILSNRATPSGVALFRISGQESCTGRAQTRLCTDLRTLGRNCRCRRAALPSEVMCNVCTDPEGRSRAGHQRG